MKFLKSKWGEFIAITAIFFILTLIATYPVMLQFTTHFMGDGGDGLQNVWNFWWFQKAIFELGQTPFYTDMLHYPTGVTLYLHTLSPVNGLISMPFSLFLNIEATYNSVALFSFVASGVTMYYLAKYLTKKHYASLIAGVIFTFSSYHYAHAMGHINLMAIQWIPLFILFFIKLLKEGGIKNSVLTGISLILVAFSSWIYLTYVAMLSVLIFIWNYKDFLKQKRRILLVSIAFVVFFFVVGPTIISMIKVLSSEQFTGGHEPWLWNADLTAYFIPGALSIFRGIFEPIWSTWGGNYLEASVFLGYTVLALGIYALIKVKKARWWGIIAFVFFILSFGSGLRILGWDTGIPMPYHLIHEYLPFARITGVTSRFGLLVNFSFAILAAYAIAHLKVKNKIWRIIVLILIIVLVFVENLSIPYLAVKIDVPEFIYEMRDEQESYSVINVPLYDTKSLYWATIHEKPLIGGYISKMPFSRVKFLQETSIINSLYAGIPYIENENPEEIADEIFNTYNIKYVIINNDEHLEFLQDTLKLNLVYDKEIKVFETGAVI